MRLQFDKVWLSSRGYDAMTYELSFNIHLKELVSTVNVPFPSKINLSNKKNIYIRIAIYFKVERFDSMHSHFLNKKQTHFQPFFFVAPLLFHRFWVCVLMDGVCV